MIATSANDRKRLSSSELRILLLLALSVFINYVDRGNLSVAAPLLKDELRLSASQLGILLSSFFWTYAFFQIPSGWLVDHLDVNWVMAFGFALWSLATAITGLAHTFAVLLLMRLILGVGESVAFPSYSKLLARHFPEHHRGFANATIAAGLSCGPAFATFAGGILMARFGWRSFFIVLGVASFVWLWPWFQWMPRGKTVAAQETTRPPDFLEIASKRSAWGTWAGLFSLNYGLYFVITWLPFYLVRERHFSMGLMAKIGGVAYLVNAAAATITGSVSDRWIASGGTPTVVRKTVMSLALTCAGISFGICVISGATLSVIMLMTASAAMGMGLSNVWAISQTIAGKQAAGKWVGLQNLVGNMAGIVAPALTGILVDRTGQFFWAFAVTSGVCLAGVVSWIFVVGRVEQIEWAEHSLPAKQIATVVQN